MPIPKLRKYRGRLQDNTRKSISILKQKRKVRKKEVLGRTLLQIPPLIGSQFLLPHGNFKQRIASFFVILAAGGIGTLYGVRKKRRLFVNANLKIGREIIHEISGTKRNESLLDFLEEEPRKKYLYVDKNGVFTKTNRPRLVKFGRVRLSIQKILDREY